MMTKQHSAAITIGSRRRRHRHGEPEREQQERRGVERRAEAARIDVVALAVPGVGAHERPGLLADEPRLPQAPASRYSRVRVTLTSV